MADKLVSVVLTDQEQMVIGVLAMAWNEFLKLPVQHPMHNQEFAMAIHQAQRLIMSRPVARAEYGASPKDVLEMSRVLPVERTTRKAADYARTADRSG